MAERLANRPVNINRSHDLMRELFSTPGSISPISHRELSMPYTAPEPPPPPEPNGTAVLLAGLVHEKHTNTADPELSVINPDPFTDVIDVFVKTNLEPHTSPVTILPVAELAQKSGIDKAVIDEIRDVRNVFEHTLQDNEPAIAVPLAEDIAKIVKELEPDPVQEENLPFVGDPLVRETVAMIARGIEVDSPDSITTVANVFVEENRENEETIDTLSIATIAEKTQIPPEQIESLSKLGHVFGKGKLNGETVLVFRHIVPLTRILDEVPVTAAD